MVVIAAGLAAMPRGVLEAARTARPVAGLPQGHDPAPRAGHFTVVFIVLINVLKVFDIVIAIAPGSVQDDAGVLAVSM